MAEAAKRYRKKPVEVEAVQWTGENREEVEAFLGADFKCSDRGAIHFGYQAASKGDFITRDEDGALEAFTGRIFQATYQPVEETHSPTLSMRHKATLTALRLFLEREVTGRGSEQRIDVGGVEKLRRILASADREAEQGGDQGLREIVCKAVRTWSDQPECDKLAAHEEDEVTDAVVAALSNGEEGGEKTYTLAQFKAALSDDELVEEMADEWTEGEEGLHPDFVRSLLGSIFGTIALEVLLDPAPPEGLADIRDFCERMAAAHADGSTEEGDVQDQLCNAYQAVLDQIAARSPAPPELQDDAKPLWTICTTCQHVLGPDDEGSCSCALAGKTPHFVIVTTASNEQGGEER